MIGKAMSKSNYGESTSVLRQQHNQGIMKVLILFVWNGRKLIACRLKLLWTQSHENFNIRF